MKKVINFVILLMAIPFFTVFGQGGGNTLNIVNTDASIDGDFVYCGSPNYNFTNKISVAAWVKWTTTPGYLTNNHESEGAWATIISMDGHITRDAGQFWLHHSSASQFFEWAVNTVGGRNYMYSTTQPVINKWYYLVGTYDANASPKMCFYVNGVLENSSSNIVSGNITTYNSSFRLDIGRMPSGYRFFSGNLDEVRIWNKALSLSEVTQQMFSKSDIASANVVSYWNMDYSTGSAVADSKGTANGTFYTALADPHNANPPANPQGYGFSYGDNWIRDNDKAWTTNMWSGLNVLVVAGNGVGNTYIVNSNTSNTLTFNKNFTTTPIVDNFGGYQSGLNGMTWFGIEGSNQSTQWISSTEPVANSTLTGFTEIGGIWDTKSSGMSSILTVSNTNIDLNSDECILWGNNNAALDETATGNPSGVTSRLNKHWKFEVHKTGGFTGKFSIDVSGLNITTGSALVLLVSNSSNFSGATTYAGNVTSNVFSVTLASAINNGAFITLGINRNCTTSAGAVTLTPSIYNDVTISSSTTSTNLNGSTINGRLTIHSTAGAFSGSATYGSSATLNYTGTSSRTTGAELPFNIANLTINNSGGVILNSNVNISNILTLTSGTFAVGANSLVISNPISGTITNLVTTSSSSLTVNGNAPLIHIPSSVTSLNNLNIDNNQVVLADANLGINGTLTLSNGILSMGANTLTIGSGTSNVGTLTRTGGSVRGTIKRWFNTSTTSNSIFPLDNGSAAYVEASISFTSAPTNGGTLTAVYHTSGSGSLPGGYIAAPELHVNFINLAPQYWTITAGDGLAGFNYNINLVANEMNISSTNYAYTGIVRRANSGANWTWNFANHVTTTSPSAIPSLGATSLTSFADFGIAGNADNLLPVELSSFTSAVIGRDVRLDWSTAQEQNNSGFDIERKSGLTDWIKIGNVAGNGTTNTVSIYTFSDKNTSSGQYNYRLKQIDYNGNFKYYELSRFVTIGTPNKFALLQNYPNPFNPTTAIRYELPSSGFVSLKVFDIVGKEAANLVNQNQEGGYYTVKFDASKLSTGIYFYRLEVNTSESKFEKVMRCILIK